MSHRRATLGYTLLELIIVIAVFAVVAAMAYGGLSYVLKSRREIQQRLARISEYQKAYQRLRDDFLNAAPRLIRDSDGAPQPVFYYDSLVHRPEFTRGGWANPAGLPRATLERVSYFLDDSDADDRKLVRRSWRVLDRAPQTQPVDLTLLHGVDKLKWRFMDTNLAWHDDWSPQASTTAGTALAGSSAAGGNPEAAAALAAAMMPVPLAAELTAQTRDWGPLRFLFRLGPEGYALAPSLAAAAASGSSGATGTSGTNGNNSGTNGSTGNVLP